MQSLHDVAKIYPVVAWLLEKYPDIAKFVKKDLSLHHEKIVHNFQCIAIEC